MRKFLFMMCLFAHTIINAQVLSNSITARSYLGSNTTWTQAEFNAYNSQPGMYQVKFPSDSSQSTAMILSYPSLDSVNVYWANGVWNTNIPTAITSNFNTLLMVSGISHTTAPQVAGVTTSSVTVTWNSIPGVTQYRLRFRPLGGNWSVNTVTGTSRTINNLSPNTIYEVVIRVYLTSIIQGSYSEQVYQFTTPQFISLPSCNSPTNVNSNIVGNQLIMSWDNMPQSVGYQIQVRELNTLSWGGTTVTTNNRTFVIDSTKAYEVQIRTSCVGTQTSWSLFSKTDTLSNVMCQSPTNLNNVGNTFNWTNYQYSSRTQIQTRLVGTTEWGGTTVTGNTWSNPILWGQHEWRVRSQCHNGTVKSFNSNSVYWTNWSYGLTNFIPKPQTFEQFNENVMYPNPANDVVNLKGKLILTDLFGRVILSGIDVLDVSHLSNGVYLLNNKKLVVQH